MLISLDKINRSYQQCLFTEKHDIFVVEMTHRKGRFAALVQLVIHIQNVSRSRPRKTLPITYPLLIHYLHSRIIFRFIIYNFHTSPQHKKYTVHDRIALF